MTNYPLKVGDRFRWRSPLWEEVIVRCVDVERNAFVCEEAKPRPFVSRNTYRKGCIITITSINRWERINKADNFNSLYEKLSSQ